MTICFLSILEFPSVQVAVKLHATFEVSWALRMLRNLPPVALLSTLSLNAVIPAINFVVLLAPLCVAIRVQPADAEQMEVVPVK